MENWQINHIHKNLVELVKVTQCNKQLLLHLFSKDVLCQEDLDKLETQEPLKATLELYKILQTRSTAYEVLCESLCETNQTGALHILTEGFANQNSGKNVLQGLTNTSIKLQTAIFEILGTRMTINTLASVINNEALNSLLTPSNLTNLIKSQPVTIVGDTVPETTFYIKRKLEMTAIVDHITFLKSCFDIFVFRNISRFELSKLCGKELTDTSSNQVEKLTVRFILLEEDDDFEDICKQSSHPIHLIHYQDGICQLIQTAGLSQHCKILFEPNPIQLDDEELLHEIKHKGIRVVSIAGNPGIGKSVLMANLAKRFRDMEQNSISFFVNFDKLKDNINAIRKSKNKCPPEEAVLVSMASTQSEKELLREIFKRSKLLIGMFIDDFVYPKEDESTPINYVISYFNQFLMSFPNFRVFIATRPEIQKSIQQDLGTVSINIQPFSKTDSQAYIIAYWQNRGISVNESLHKYTYSCMLELESNHKNLSEFIESPHHCSLLAEAHLGGAAKHSKMNFKNVKIRVSVFSIIAEYLQKKSLVKKLNEELHNVHILYALHTSFKGDSAWYKYLFNKNDLKAYAQSKINKVSTNLEFINFLDETSPKFFSNTISWYLIAEWLFQVSRDLTNKQFIIRHFLSTTSFEEINMFKLDALKNKSIKFCRFRNAEICYFFNELLKTSAQSIDHNKTTTIDTVQLSEEIYNVAVACIIHDYHSIFKCFFQSSLLMFLKSNKKAETLANSLLYLAAKYSSITVLKDFIHLLKSFITDQSFWDNIICIATERGEYTITEYLLHTSDSKTGKWFLHACVNQSYGESDEIINLKVDMIKLIVSINTNFLHEKLNNLPPILMNSVHPELMKCLINEGADVHATSPLGSNITHVIAEYLNSIEYHDFVYFLFENKLINNLYQIKNLISVTPLHLGILYCELRCETLNLLCREGVNFNECDDDGENVLFYAIRGGRSIQSIQNLVHLGCNYNQTNNQGRTVIHTAAQYGHMPAMQYFFGQGLDVNKVDNDGYTPMHFACLGFKVELIGEILSLLIEMGGDLKRKGNDGRTVEDVAFTRGLQIVVK